MSSPPRLIDLHCDWLLQYAPETTVFDAALYPGIESRLTQAEGYLTGASASIIACYRRSADWARQADPWQALGQLITRIEAEFPGRILMGPDDHARWRDDPEGLCWAVIGIEGFDTLIRGPADLGLLRGLFDRGVRLFQPVYTEVNALAGSSVAGDDRGLTDLGRAFLGSLYDLVADGPGPRPVLDLSHLNPTSASDVLTWFESEPARLSRLIPVYSHGAPAHAGFATPRAISFENLTRLRALGGVVGFSVGPPFFATTEALKAGIEAAAAVPFLGQPGYEGIAIGTDFLGVQRTLPGLGNAEEVVAWLGSAYDPETAEKLIASNARRLLGRVVGAVEV